MNNYQKIFVRFNDWLITKADLGYTDLTCDHYLRIIQAFLHFLDAYAISRLQDVSLDVLKQFITTKPDHSLYKPKSILVRQAALALFFSWAFKNRLCSENIFLRYRKAQVHLKEYKIDLLTKDKEPDSLMILSKDEQQYLLNTLQLATTFIEKRTAAIMSLILATGLHREETCQLTLQDFHWSKGKLSIKGDLKEREAIIDKALCEKAIQNWLKSREETLKGQTCNWLFFTERLHPIRPDKLTFYMKLFFEKTDISSEKATANCLRQTAIFSWVANKVPLEKVQAQFGFKQLASLRRYLFS